jgi:hypothetical protein
MTSTKENQMTEFEKWAAGYMKRARVEEENTFFIMQQWRDCYEAGYLKGYSVGRRDEKVIDKIKE